jgi:hypothetical protein
MGGDRGLGLPSHDGIFAIPRAANKARRSAGPCRCNRCGGLLLLLTLRMGLVAVLAGGLRMLLGARRMLAALGVIALAVMFRRRAMGFRRILMMFGSLVVFVACHVGPRLMFAPSVGQTLGKPIVPGTRAQISPLDGVTCGVLNPVP